MADTYQPDLGQMIFGQPSKEYECSPLLEAGLCYLREELDRVLWNRLQRECPSPFNNAGARFETDGLIIHAYSWGDDEQPFNFKCGDVEVSWYKYLGRGMSVNRPMPPDEVSAMLDTALRIIRECEDESQAGEAVRTFTYD